MNLRNWSAGALILLLVSCTQSNQGIFASIEREQKIKSAGGLNSDTTVSSMAELNGRYYIAGGGALFQKAVPDIKWSPSVPGSGSGYEHAMSVGRVGSLTQGTLLAVANKNATNTDQLFSLSSDGSTWTAVAVPLGYQAFSLVPIILNTDGFSSSELLLTLTSTTDGSYGKVLIIKSTGALGAYILGPLTDLNFAYGFPITGAASAGTSNYYFVNNDAVFHFDGTAVHTVTGSDMNGTGYYGVLILPASAPAGLTSLAIVSSLKGALFWGTLNNSDSTWEEVGRKTGIEDEISNGVTMGPMIYQDQGSTKYVWIGTLNGVLNQGAGIASLTAPTSSTYSIALQAPGGTDSDNYKSTILMTSQIWSLFRASDKSYFAGTGAEGLWQWSPTAQTWSQQ